MLGIIKHKDVLSSISSTITNEELSKLSLGPPMNL